MIINNTVRCLVYDDMSNVYSGMLVSYSAGIAKVLFTQGNVLTIDAKFVFVSLVDLEAVL